MAYHLIVVSRRRLDPTPSSTDSPFLARNLASASYKDIR